MTAAVTRTLRIAIVSPIQAKTSAFALISSSGSMRCWSDVALMRKLLTCLLSPVFSSLSSGTDVGGGGSSLSASSCNWAVSNPCSFRGCFQCLFFRFWLNVNGHG